MKLNVIITPEFLASHATLTTTASDMARKNSASASIAFPAGPLTIQASAIAGDVAATFATFAGGSPSSVRLT